MASSDTSDDLDAFFAIIKLHGKPITRCMKQSIATTPTTTMTRSTLTALIHSRLASSYVSYSDWRVTDIFIKWKDLDSARKNNAVCWIDGSSNSYDLSILNAGRLVLARMDDARLKLALELMERDPKDGWFQVWVEDGRAVPMRRPREGVRYVKA